MFNAWAAENHIRASEITAVDKLSFIGKRGMGALEFEIRQEKPAEDTYSIVGSDDSGRHLLRAADGSVRRFGIAIR